MQINMQHWDPTAADGLTIKWSILEHEKDQVLGIKLTDVKHDRPSKFSQAVEQAFQVLGMYVVEDIRFREDELKLELRHYRDVKAVVSLEFSLPTQREGAFGRLEAYDVMNADKHPKALMALMYLRQMRVTKVGEPMYDAPTYATETKVYPAPKVSAGGEP